MLVLEDVENDVLKWKAFALKYKFGPNMVLVDCTISVLPRADFSSFVVLSLSSQKRQLLSPRFHILPTIGVGDTCCRLGQPDSGTPVVVHDFTCS